MDRVAKFILIPLFAPLAIVGLYLMPVSVLGCANRGLAALAVVLISLIAGIVTGLRGIRAQHGKDGLWGWWFAAACILALPALLVLGPLG